MQSASVRPYSISVGPTVNVPRIIAVASVLGFIAMALIGQPGVGAILLLPWLSATLLLHPGWLLASYLYIPFYKSAIEGFTPIDATVWLAILCIISFSYQSRKLGSLQVSFVTMLWWIFSVVMTLATMWSTDPPHSLNVLVNFLALTFLPLLLAFIVATDRSFLAQFLRITFYGAVALSAAGAISVIVSDSGRLALTANTIGSGRIAMIALLVAPVVVKDSKWKPVILTLVTLLSLFAVLASGSRGPLLAGAVSLIAVYGVWSRWFTFRLLGVSIALALGWAALLSNWIEALIPPAALGRIRSLVEAAFTDGELDGSSGARVHLITEAWSMWERRPFTGWGPGSFEIFAKSSLVLGNHEYPHNSVLQAAAELGLPGLILFVALLLLGGVNVFRSYGDRLARGVGALMVFAVLSALVSNDLYDNRWMWGMILLAGSMPLMRRVSDKNISESDSRIASGNYSP